MSNPFDRFDLEGALDGLPDSLRNPMALAVGASLVTHGVFFIGLPAFSGIQTKEEKPERIVNVIELSPQEQAQLPQSTMAGQFPMNTTSPLKTNPLASLPQFPQVPLTDLGPSVPLFGGSSVPSGISQPSIGGGYLEPIRQPDPIIIYRDNPRTKPEENKEDKKSDEQNPDSKKENPDQTKMPPGGDKKVPPVNGLTPEQAAEQARLAKEEADKKAKADEVAKREARQQQLAAIAPGMKYAVAGTTESDERDGLVGSGNAVKIQLINDGLLDVEFGAPSSVLLNEIMTEPDWPSELPDGQTLPEKVGAKFMVYVNPQGVPMGIGADKAKQSPAIFLTRSTGFPHLNKLAQDEVVKYFQNPDKVKEIQANGQKNNRSYQAIEFSIPVDLRPMKAGNKPAA